jgi:hypothetical protein
MARRSQILSKAGLLVFGMIIAGSTVYALVLRTRPDARRQTVEEATAPVKVVRAAVAPSPVPRVWGRLVKMELPEEPTGEAAPAKKLTITTPMIHITAGPEPTRRTEAPPRRRAKARPAAVAKPSVGPAGQLPPDGSGVMARFKAVPKPKENLPEAPDRVDIVRVMGSVRGKVQDCYDTGMVPGQVDLLLVVAGDTGRVKRAKVSADSSTATCIKRVAQTLRFPRFSRDKVTIRYPYAFR